MSVDLNVMRQSLIFGGLEAIIRNINHKNQNIRLYEFGNVYKYNKESKALKAYNEEEKIAIFLSGNKNEKHWKTDNISFTFYDIKSTVNRIFKRIGFDVESFNISETENKKFAYGLNYKYKNNTLAEFGLLSTVLSGYFGIEQEIFYAEINWQLLLKNIPVKNQFKSVSKYPSVKRDLALLVDKDIKFEQIKAIAENANKKLLKHTDIFDIFEDKKLGENKKSYAVSFIFQDEQKTLKDKQVNKIMTKIINNCKSQLHAEIR